MYILLEPNEIANNIVQRCKENGISVRALCQSLQIGVNTIQQMRKDGHYPRVDTLFKIASGLGCRIEDLCTMVTEDESNEGVEE